MILCCLAYLTAKPPQTLVEQLIALKKHRVNTIIDLSTIGIAAAQHIHTLCTAANLNFIDCPVSGGVAGAKAGTVTVIWAGPGELLTQHRAVLEAIGAHIFHVGDQAGQGQALKLLNNFFIRNSHGGHQ